MKYLYQGVLYAKLITQPTAQVKILDFQTFTTEYVAERYGIDSNSLLKAKNRHTDEIIENLHFIVEKNERNRLLIKWTLRGIIKLGMFIRSKETKTFRLWAEQELEKAILKQISDLKSSKLKLDKKYNKELLSKDKHIKELEDIIRLKNKKINDLATKIVLFDSKSYNPSFKELENLRDDMINFHYKLSNSIKGILKKKYLNLKS